GPRLDIGEREEALRVFDVEGLLAAPSSAAAAAPSAGSAAGLTTARAAEAAAARAATAPALIASGPALSAARAAARSALLSAPRAAGPSLALAQERHREARHRLAGLGDHHLALHGAEVHELDLELLVDLHPIDRLVREALGGGEDLVWPGAEVPQLERAVL